MNKKVFYILAAGVVAFILIFIFNNPASNKLGAGITIPTQQAFSTSTSVTVTTASTLVLATSSRMYVAISNSGPQSVWLQLTGTAAVLNKGVLLPASTTYEMSVEKGNPYYGAIFGISAGTASNVLTITGF